jgi:hypothetical protein
LGVDPKNPHQLELLTCILVMITLWNGVLAHGHLQSDRMTRIIPSGVPTRCCSLYRISQTPSASRKSVGHEYVLGAMQKWVFLSKLPEVGGLHLHYEQMAA